MLNIQSRRLALWLPVLVGLGVWLRFGPSAAEWRVWAALIIALGALGLWRRNLAGAALIAIALGGLAAELRLYAVDAPILAAETEALIEGRVVAVSRTRAGAPRVTLSPVTIEGLHVAATPQRVRIALLEIRHPPGIGQRIRLKASLSPPPGPAEPGAYDASFAARFDRLGAVGYARVSEFERLPSSGALPPALRLEQWRMETADTLRQRIGGAEGAVAAALTVGDRSGLDPGTLEALRDSGLAHLLAISGLHLGLLSLLVFGGMRLALSLHPRLSEGFATRKFAALAALAAALAYLLASGMGIATQRAFVMVSVAFAAVLIDRPAVTMRALAFAAALILILRPESLFQAGFQMSFAAVAALVAAYEVTRGFWSRRAKKRGIAPWLLTALMASAMTSAIAGMATAPFAAHHFNRLVLVSLPANLLATPLMGLAIMPLVILSAVLSVLGLEGPALWLLGEGIGLILRVAKYFAARDPAVLGIPAGTPLSLGMIVLGGLWLTLWRGWLRLGGVAALALGLALWAEAPRPDLLISRDARLIAGRTIDGALWLSRERTNGYAAELWLRRDGDIRANRIAAYGRRRWQCDRSACEGETAGGWDVRLNRRSGAVTLEREDAQIALDPKALRTASGIAIYLSDPPRVEISEAWLPR